MITEPKEPPQSLGEIIERASESTFAFIKRKKTVIQYLEDLKEFLFEMDMHCQGGDDGRNKDHEEDHKEVIFRKVAFALHLCLYNLCLSKELGKKIEDIDKTQLLTLICSLIFRISDKIDPSNKGALEKKLEIFSAQ